MQNTATFKPLTNRSSDAKAWALPEDGFVMLVPKGEAPNKLGGKAIIQVVDDEALQSMMNRLLASADQQMLIDDEHFSHDPSKGTDANGWQLHSRDTLSVRDDGLYGSPSWSTMGMDNLTGGKKRFISPEFNSATVVHLGGARYRVTELTGLALTNRPGFKQLQKPLTNRDADDGIDTATTHTHMHKALLAAHLGITDTVIDTLDETTLKNRLSDIKTKADKVGTLETEIATLKNRDADAFITAHDKVIPKEPKVREHLKQTFLANREMAELVVSGFIAAVQADGLTPEQRERAQKKPLFNRGTAEVPENDEALKNRETVRASKVASRAKELCNREQGLAWSEAWRRADAETPELE